MVIAGIGVVEGEASIGYLFVVVFAPLATMAAMAEIVELVVVLVLVAMMGLVTH